VEEICWGVGLWGKKGRLLEELSHAPRVSQKQKIHKRERRSSPAKTGWSEPTENGSRERRNMWVLGMYR